VTIVYRKISHKLFWGFEQKKTRYNSYRIAEPEKAFLDWIYLSRQEGLPTPLDEINVQFLDVSKLRSYAKKFPRTVDEVVKAWFREIVPSLDRSSPDAAEQSRGYCFAVFKPMISAWLR
jgi:hypothetical protein